MDSEEWKFLLDFTQNQEEAAKNGANAIVSDRDDTIGKLSIKVKLQILGCQFCIIFYDFVILS